VSSTPFFIESSKRLGLSKPFNSFVKATFFRHFCGGENLKEVIPTVENFEASNIGSILDLAMEADLDGKPLAGKEAEDFAANIAKMMNESIEIASARPGNFIALKVTAFVPPGILQRWTTSLRHFKEVYMREFQNGKVSKSDFFRLSKHFSTFNEKLQQELFAAADNDNDGLIDWLDVSSVMTLSNPQFANILALEGQGNQFVTLDDIQTAQLVLKQLEKVCDYARTKKVAIMIDAEQTYFQSAIDDIALRLCKKYNVPLDKSDESGMKHAIIYNTYQLYLKDAYDRLVADIQLAKRLKYSFGVKIVRGAYMVSERDRANELSYSSPINDTIEDTHKSFNKACEFLIESLAESASEASQVQPLRFVVASHNKNSISYVYKLLDMHPKINASDGTVAFAQLMGMQDKTTYGLAAKGVKAYKVIFNHMKFLVYTLWPSGSDNTVSISQSSRKFFSSWRLWGGYAKYHKGAFVEIKWKQINPGSITNDMHEYPDMSGQRT
jgi:hypothetical protein